MMGVIHRIADPAKEFESIVSLIDLFFFKQKTPYDVVDCDWSSDVCSSDLGLI